MLFGIEATARLQPKPAQPICTVLIFFSLQNSFLVYKTLPQFKFYYIDIAH